MKKKKYPELDRLSRNILYLRQIHQLSKRKMAKLLEIRTTTLARIEKGNYPKDTDVGILFRLYIHFGIMPSVLLGEELESREVENESEH